MSVERSGNDVRVHPTGPVVGAVRPPGSKSLTNRCLACAALADGRSVLRGASFADDTFAMVRGLAQLGVRTETLTPRAELHVFGARGNLTGDEVTINVGGAGTAMRFLAALACLGHGRRRLDGSARMRARPIGQLVGALQQLGARIGYEAGEGYPPLTVVGGGLTGGEVAFADPPSSQFLSAVLMVAPYAAHDVLIRIDGEVPSRPYVDMTVDVMRSMGVEAVEHAGRFVVPAYQRYQGGEFAVEPDASAATYFWAAAAVTGGRVRVAGLTRQSRQGDVRFADVLGRMGCVVSEDERGLTVAAPADGPLQGVTVDLNDMPDTVQTLAVVALFAAGPTEIHNVANLRVKETDRLAALSTELTRLGARVEERPDGLTIHPPNRISPAAIATYDDHRMAMSFAVAGLAAEGIVIRDAGCVRKSYPGFFEALEELTRGARP
ncbi:MAG: 3-phosphoshikimate 1-carboxyvinyltransferase [Planctomycetota bacterium]